MGRYPYLCSLLVASVGEWYEELSFFLSPSWCRYISLMYAREKSNDVPSDAINLRVYLEIWVDFPYLCTRKRNERPCGDAGSLTFRDL